VINEGGTREGVISAFHFSETRVFDLFSHNNIKTPKGLAMINGAAMPPQLTVKPSYNTSASTKALIVQHPYQAWLPCRLMI
jgi:hypothetical protein